MRIWCGLLMILVALYLPFWCFALMAFIYTCIWLPYELLVLAVLIDAQFGSTQLVHSYTYTLAISIFILASIYTKPFLRFYK